MRILHLLDATVPGDSFDILAHLLSPHAPPADYHLAALGHRSTGTLASQAGLSARSITWLPSMGWADPTGWRAARRLIEKIAPTHIHAWGIPAIVAASASLIPAHRLATFTLPPSRTQLRLLRMVEKRIPWTWTATSSSIERVLLTGGLKTERVVRIRPAVGIPAAMPSTQADDLKTDLDIQPSDGPILLLGGEGRSARHDFGLWAAAILQQMFPNTRVIVREDPRGTPNPGLDRFLNALPAERTIVVAPPELTWRQLVSIADVLVVTPDSATAIGSILEAMAQKVPVIGTPIECVTELIENGRTGLLARTVTPRAIAARLEEFTNDLTLKERLSAEAYERVVSQFSIARMVEEYSRVYAGDARSPSATANAC